VTVTVTKLQCVVASGHGLSIQQAMFYQMHLAMFYLPMQQAMFYQCNWPCFIYECNSPGHVLSMQHAMFYAMFYL
jgi:hypothetical protein